MRRALVLTQSDVLDFTDFPGKTLPSLRSGSWGEIGGKLEGAVGVEGVGTKIGM